MTPEEIVKRFNELEYALKTHTHTGADNSSVFTTVRIIGVEVFASAADVTTGDGKAFVRIPQDMEGYILNSVFATVYTAGTTNTTDIQLRNKTNSADILTTKVTIDSTETDSRTAATAPVINYANAGVKNGDVIAIDVDAASTTKPLGLFVEMRFIKT